MVLPIPEVNLKRKNLKKLYDTVFSHKLYLAGAFVFALLFILFTEQIKAFIIIGLLGLAASFSTIYKRSFQAPPVFELITLTIVIVSVLYGPLIGILFAIIINFTSEVIAGAVDVFTIIYTGPRIIMAVAAGVIFNTFPDMSFATLGLISVLIFNALQQPVYFWLVDVEKRVKGLYFTVLNIPINYFIFKFIGAPLFEILRRLV